MDNITIEKGNVTKFLGVLIDGNLSWKQHINDISTKASKSIGILYNSRGIVKPPSVKQLYFSFIHCHLSYANIAWANTYKSELEGLYYHQKHAAHIIISKDKFTHVQLLLYDMKVLNIFQINLFHIIILYSNVKRI